MTSFSALALNLSASNSNNEGFYAFHPVIHTSEIAAISNKGLAERELQKALHYIHQHLASEMSLKKIAAHLNMSQFYFCRLFKQSMGVTPYQYLLQQRVARAKQLLLQDETSIAEVALAVGFASQSHLCMHFKRRVGVTPKQFAQQ